MKLEKELSPGWITTTLGQLFLNPKANIVDGPFGSHLKASEYQPQGTPILRIQNIKRLKFVPKNIKYITSKKARELTRHSYLPGDIIITKLGDPLGEACIVPSTVKEGVIVADLVRLRLDNGHIDNRWLCYAINADGIANQLKIATKGTTRPRVNLTHIRELRIDVPPLNEQRRIVSKVDELFSELDKGVEFLTAARQQLKAYRQSVLKAALEGKLTTNWRAKNKGRIEPATNVLAKLKADKSKRAKARKDVPNLTQDELSELPSIPNEWGWCKLNDLAVKITDGEHFRPVTQERGVYFLSAKDVRESGVSLEAPLFVSEETARKARKRCDPEKGDLLIVSRGATVGRMCVVDIDDTFCLLGSVILIKVAPGLATSFLISALKSPRINRTIVTTSGSTAQQAIYLRDVQHVAVPICSLEEQNEIARLLDEKLTNADELEAAIDREMMRAESLRRSIIRRAFSGQIVAQDPADESASILLERIRAEQIDRGERRRRANKNNKKEAA
jgi:type I restriction enzyme S subunit